MMAAKASRRRIALECNAAIFANTFAPGFGALAFTPPHAGALLRRGPVASAVRSHGEAQTVVDTLAMVEVARAKTKQSAGVRNAVGSWCPAAASTTKWRAGACNGKRC